MKNKTVYLLLLALVATCNAYSFGAPPIACTSMMPAHSGIPPQSSTPPIALTVSANSYTASSVLTGKVVSFTLKYQFITFRY